MPVLLLVATKPVDKYNENKSYSYFSIYDSVCGARAFQTTTANVINKFVLRSREPESQRTSERNARRETRVNDDQCVRCNLKE